MYEKTLNFFITFDATAYCFYFNFLVKITNPTKLI